MNIRYTTRLFEGGQEVWKRWTGDREEALRDLATTLVDLQCPEPRAQWTMANASTLEADLKIGEQRGLSTYNNDMTTELSFEVRRKS